ncbi:universal stress protein [Paenibacillus sp. WLX1005]|uniref:universal stress protein n=1 Tax=Paenibacillus sp. WLX1005 TaxID=3243766 RepID=UPI0039841749
MYNHILIAADGSDNSLRAAGEAVQLAQLNPQVTVEVLFVAEPDKIKDEVLQSHNHDEIQYHRQEKVQPILDTFRHAGIEPKLTTVNGEPGATIVDYAHKQNVDLIVIGSRGLNSLQELVLGSVSHKVIKRAHCPVLIVK